MDDRAEFDANLLAPFPGEKGKAPSPREIEDDGASFMAFMGEVTGG